MKKTFLLLISIMIIFATSNLAYSKQTQDAELTNAIKLYKAGNYTQCYDELSEYVKNNSGNALAYYYLAIASTQIGKSGEAIINYERTLALTDSKTKLARYAAKGKACIETPDKCSQFSLYNSVEEQFILNKTGPNVTEQVKSEFERLKLENMMREMNRVNDIDPERFKEYRDFSSMNPDGAPSNDEIVAAMRTLQKAGLGNFANTHNYNDLTLLTGENYTQNSLYNMFGAQRGNLQGVNPQLIQTMLTNNMSLGF